MSAFTTPVVIFVFNRTQTLRRLLTVLAELRPATLMIVADGPRASHGEDERRCAAVRALVERVEWPCSVRRNYAAANLGCDRRIESGVDWVFDQVDEAIFLEDDLLPDPSFFTWCHEMLSRYRRDPSVMQAVGRNELAQWHRAFGDHHLIWRASPLGWATWRDTWIAGQSVPLPGEQSAIDRLVAQGRLDPLLGEHFTMLRDLVQHGGATAWDSRWALRRVLLGGATAVPPMNLVAHDIFDSDATHNRFANDIRRLQPIGKASAPVGGFKPVPDARLDRWALLLDLLATYRELSAVRRLARAPKLPIGHSLRHHLAPFALREETIAALRHLQGCLSDPAALAPLLELFDDSGATAEPMGSGAD